MRVAAGRLDAEGALNDRAALRIEEELGDSARYGGRAVLKAYRPG